MEILVYVRNNTHPDPIKDRRGSFKRGMAVVIYDDGHVWGREESKQVWIAEGSDPALWPGQGKWVIVKVPGVLAATVATALDDQQEDDTGATYLDATGSPARFRLRRWYFMLDSLPIAVRDALAANGEVTATKAQIKPYIARIRDGLQYSVAGW